MVGRNLFSSLALGLKRQLIMKTLICSIFAMFPLVSSLAIEPELKGSPAELAAYLATVPRTVALRGEGEVKAQADRARVALKVTTENKSLADALRANEQVRGKLAAFLREQGIDSDRIHASKFSSTPKYGYFSEKAKLQKVENQVEVTVRNEKELQAVAAVPDKFPEATYLNAEFEQSDKDHFRTEAITKACEDAERQKRVFEQKLGLKLTPRGFNEQFFSRPTTRDRIVGGMPPSHSGLQHTTPLAGHGGEAEEPTESISSFGELIFKVVVTIEYSAESAQKP